MLALFIIYNSMKSRRTKIVCTLGPASSSLTMIKKMIKAGMNVVRCNFSHGTYTTHKKLINTVRKACKELNKEVALIQDLQGPKIRVGCLPDEGILLKAKTRVIFDTSLKEYHKKNKALPLDYSELHLYVKKGERIFFDDGKLSAKIIKVTGTQIQVEMVIGGVLHKYKGINVPDSQLGVRAMTDKDIKDVLFGVKNHVDYIALSFVRTVKDVLDLRYLIQDYEKKLGIVSSQPIKIIVKVEMWEAVKNIKEILEVSDAIMIARGDLGVEIPPEKVPLVQKQLIDEALAASKPVIVATQMLDSMQNNLRPTRAEVSDVSNAVIDHTDAVMLSNETAVGKYPVETIQMMHNIILETENSVYDDLEISKDNKKKKRINDAVSEMSKILADQIEAEIILVASISGDTARLVSRYRPELPIMVATNNFRVKNQLILSWGIFPFLLPTCKTIEELIERSIIYLKKNKYVKKNDKIIVVAGEPVGKTGNANLLKIREIK